MQETFMIAWQKFEIFSEHPNKMGWLKQVAKYKLLEYAAKNQQMKIGRTQEAGTQERTEKGIKEQGYSLQEWKIVLEKLFSVQDVKWFFDYYCMGIPSKVLAKEAGMPEGSMRSKLSRMMNRVRGNLNNF